MQKARVESIWPSGEYPARSVSPAPLRLPLKMTLERTS
jgi:hypothetical protein